MAHIKFVISEEECIIELKYIKEVVPYLNVLKSNLTNTHIKGYINLRGTILPVLDLSKVFFNLEAKRTLNSRILILEYEKNLVGVIVNEIIDINKFAKERFIYDFLAPDWVESIVMESGKVVKKINPVYLFNLCYSQPIQVKE